jgi:hypothetical protein
MPWHSWNLREKKQITSAIRPFEAHVNVFKELRFGSICQLTALLNVVSNRRVSKLGNDLYWKNSAAVLSAKLGIMQHHQRKKLDIMSNNLWSKSSLGKQKERKHREFNLWRTEVQIDQIWIRPGDQKHEYEDLGTGKHQHMAFVALLFVKPCPAPAITRDTHLSH